MLIFGKRPSGTLLTPIGASRSEPDGENRRRGRLARDACSARSVKGTRSTRGRFGAHCTLGSASAERSVECSGPVGVDGAVGTVGTAGTVGDAGIEGVVGDAGTEGAVGVCAALRASDAGFGSRCAAFCAASRSRFSLRFSAAFRPALLRFRLFFRRNIWAVNRDGGQRLSRLSVCKNLYRGKSFSVASVMTSVMAFLACQTYQTF